MLDRIRDVGGDDIHDRGTGPTRNRERLHVEVRPFWIHGFHNGRQEDRVGEELDVGGEIDQGERPDFPVFEGGHDVRAVGRLG